MAHCGEEKSETIEKRSQAGKLSVVTKDGVGIRRWWFSNQDEKKNGGLKVASGAVDLADGAVEDDPAILVLDRRIGSTEELQRRFRRWFSSSEEIAEEEITERRNHTGVRLVLDPRAGAGKEEGTEGFGLGV
ncbi:hypothetical protein U1Q18_021703 [Sarracenia purpurea var. burkii]